jgi:hypothetical protein
MPASENLAGLAIAHCSIGWSGIVGFIGQRSRGLRASFLPHPGQRRKPKKLT